MCIPHTILTMMRHHDDNGSLFAKSASQRLLVNISENLMFVPHQIVIMTKVNLAVAIAQKRFGLSHGRRHLDRVGRCPTFSTTGDPPRIGAEEKGREEQGGGELDAGHGDDGEDSNGGGSKTIHFDTCDG